MKLTIKENSTNYTCTVVEIKNVFPIEGADKIQRTVIYGNNVVISKDIKVGDKMLYFVSGTRLNEDFCKYNNLLDKAELNNDTTKKGFISYKQFRVKAIKLRGIVSDGMLMPILSLAPILGVGKNLEKLEVGMEFTDIDDISVCEKYFVPVRNSNPGGKAPKQPKRINRLVDNQFYLHNDTENLRRNMDKLNPNDIIGIHYKKHGTSAVIGNVLVKKKLSLKEKVFKFLGANIVDKEYDIVYSSRKVIKNQYLNPESGNGFYGEDIWGIVAKEIGHLIPKGWTLYGEIIGYTPGGSAIQSMGGRDYDYGCKKGMHKFYVYKISIVNQDGSVIYLDDKQIEEYCEKVGLLFKDTFIYYGFAYALFSRLYSKKHSFNLEEWRNKFLELLEKEYNEKDCYMCTNNVPEEGIVVRIQRLNSYEAYKLKSKRFILGESESQEKGESNLEDNQ